MNGPKVSIKIKLVLKKDYEKLIEFLTNFEDEKRDSEFWLARLLCWWDKNPAFSERIDRGWILYRTDNSQIVGFIGNIPSFFQFKNKKKLVFSATTWRVDSAYRNRSLLLFSNLLKCSDNSILFDTTPSQEVIKILQAFKFKYFPNQINHNHFYVINFNNMFKHYISESKLLLFLIQPFLSLIMLFQYMRLFRIKASDNTRQIYKAGPEFHALWEKTKNNYQNTNIRTADIVNWHCFGNHYSEKILFGYFDNDDLQTYAIYSVVPNNNLKMLILADIWGSDMDTKILENLVATSIKYGKTNKYDVILYPGFNVQQTRAYKGMGLFHRKTADHRFLKLPSTNANSLESGETYLTFLQGDYGL